MYDFFRRGEDKRFESGRFWTNSLPFLSKQAPLPDLRVVDFEPIAHPFLASKQTRMTHHDSMKKKMDAYQVLYKWLHFNCFLACAINNTYYYTMVYKIQECELGIQLLTPYEIVAHYLDEKIEECCMWF